MIQTLFVQQRVGESIIGTAALSPEFGTVEIGRCAPVLRTSEDAAALVRNQALDPTLPIEVNVLKGDLIRGKLARLDAEKPLHPEWGDPKSILAGRPVISYMPAESMYGQHPKSIEALGKTGKYGTEVAKLRATTTQTTFWEGIAERKLLAPWVGELVQKTSLLNGCLFAPPVPVIDNDSPSSPEVQAQVNRALSIQWPLIVAQRRIGLLYGMSFDASALRSTDITRRALLACEATLSQGDLNFFGVHIAFTDMTKLTNSKVRAAKELYTKVSQLARRHNVFTWVSDVGAPGPIMLDLGAAFTSYHAGMTPRTIFSGFAPQDDELKFGKTLGLWNYTLHSREDVRNRGDTMDDTGTFPWRVPANALGEASYPNYRINFGKPYNASVMEWLNQARIKELRDKRNPRPGTDHIHRNSTDPRIHPWSE